MKKMGKKEKIYSRKRKNSVLLIAELLLGVIFIFAIFQLYVIVQDYNCAKKEYDQLALYVETENNAETSGNSDISGEMSYRIKWDDLKKINDDFIGWIILPESKLNYPIVKSKDNEEYLTTTFEGRHSSSGAIFMDMDCEDGLQSENVIIYGHNMKNGTMFRELNNLTEEDYFLKHRTFYIDAGRGFEDYEIISCYQTQENDSNSWKIYFRTKTEYKEWLKKITGKSFYQCKAYDANKNTITLSTCRGESGGSGRFIVHLQKR